ncbi:hypothetical protein B9Z55_006400 [Caenorhabditis nigoni]|nr:hypothetical protein B9Z55_006400 [Caenorhabditis nigoni]
MKERNTKLTWKLKNERSETNEIRDFRVYSSTLAVLPPKVCVCGSPSSEPHNVKTTVTAAKKAHKLGGSERVIGKWAESETKMQVAHGFAAQLFYLSLLRSRGKWYLRGKDGRDLTV